MSSRLFVELQSSLADPRYLPRIPRVLQAAKKPFMCLGKKSCLIISCRPQMSPVSFTSILMPLATFILSHHYLDALLSRFTLVKHQSKLSHVTLVASLLTANRLSAIRRGASRFIGRYGLHHTRTTKRADCHGITCSFQFYTFCSR